MKGNIQTDDKCPLCGRTLKYAGKGFICLDHPQKVHQSRRIRVFFGKEVRRRFNNLQEAERFLNGLRFKEDEGTFDKRDYKADNPLGFTTQSDKWLGVKKGEVGHNSWRDLNCSMRKAQAAWGQRNVKTIQYGEFEDFLASLNHLSSKTRHNVRSALSQFFAWLSKRENIKPPEIPKVKFELGWREIIDLETQTAILDHLHKIAPLKVYVGVRWLATYVAIRPNEMRCLRERDINVNGFFVIPSPKEKKPKLVPMLPEDIKLYESFPSGFPHLFFFRHEKGNGGAKPGDQFSKEMFRRWWNQACRELGIKDVDCYGGTRHSTASAIGQYFTKEEMRDHGTMHATNKAFERYMQHETAPSLKIYEMARKMRGGES